MDENKKNCGCNNEAKQDQNTACCKDASKAKDESCCKEESCCTTEEKSGRRSGCC